MESKIIKRQVQKQFSEFNKTKTRKMDLSSIVEYVKVNQLQNGIRITERIVLKMNKKDLQKKNKSWTG